MIDKFVKINIGNAFGVTKRKIKIVMQPQNICYFLHRLKLISVNQRNATEREIYRLLCDPNLSTPYNIMNAIGTNLVGKQVYLSNNQHASWDHIFSCFTHTITNFPHVVSEKQFSIIWQNYMKGYVDILGDLVLEIVAHDNKISPVQPTQSIQDMLR